MTTIEYDRTLDDILQFNIYHIKSSPLLRRQMLITRIAVSLLTAVLSFMCIYIIDIDKQLNTMALIAPIIGGIAIFLSFPWLNMSGIRKRTLKLLQEGSNKGLLGRQKVTIQPSGLYCESSYSDSMVKWEGIGRVVTTDHSILIYVGSANAIVIPERAFANEAAMHAFANQIQQHITAT